MNLKSLKLHKQHLEIGWKILLRFPISYYEAANSGVLQIICGAATRKVKLLRHNAMEAKLVSEISQKCQDVD